MYDSDCNMAFDNTFSNKFQSIYLYIISDIPLNNGRHMVFEVVTEISYIQDKIYILLNYKNEISYKIIYLIL